MAPENEVTLYVNGKKYLGWTSVQIEVSVNSLVRVCQLGVARTSNRASLCEGIEEGLEAVVKIGSDTLLAGFIADR
ncbi:phage baseplate assembly protein [Mesosutterella porci]|uniref:phage baseplate assembly protein n=1 Tax=Mesosutterella porci TaxID=2915351 RepID=UPI00351D3A87